MKKSEAIKTSIRELVDEHPALSNADAMMMFGVLNKYGIDLLMKLHTEIEKKTTDDVPDKYKRVRGAVKSLNRI